MADLEAITKALDQAKALYVAFLGAQADLDRISAEQGTLLQASEGTLAESKRKAEATMKVAVEKAVAIQRGVKDEANQAIAEAQGAVSDAEKFRQAHVDKIMEELSINVNPVVSAGGGHTRL